MQVFENASFYACDKDFSNFSVLVEENGKIVYTGSKVPEKYISAPRMDLGGRCVVPAFADTHIHFSSYAYFNAGLDCRNATDLNDLAGMVAEYEQNHPKEKVILGFGCSAHTLKEKRLPEKSDLDRITSRPLMIVKYDGHGAVGNSALIARLPGKVFNNQGFDAKTGWFYLDAFYAAVNHISKSVSLPQLFSNLISASHSMAQNGIVLIHPAEGVGFPLDLDVDTMRFAALGLPQEFRIFFQTLEVKKVLKRKLPRIGGCFACALDGCFGSEDAALNEPYTTNPNNKGMLFYDDKTVRDFVLSAHRAGLQVALHAIGDAAVDQALAAFEHAIEKAPRQDHRHIIIHANLMSDEAIEKAARLNIHIALQSPFLYWELEPMEYVESILGDRAHTMIPLKKMLDAGIVFANGSDAPCTIPDPIAGIHAACNHPNLELSIGVKEALRMQTINGAILSFDENDRGSLETGKAADFVVLDTDITKIPKEKIKDVKIEKVYFGGNLYQQDVKSPMTLAMKSVSHWLRK